MNGRLIAPLLALLELCAGWVGAQISRRYADFNRKAQDASGAPAAAPVCDEYYAASRRALRAVRNPPGAPLVDVHGRSLNQSAIFRGTVIGIGSAANWRATPERIEQTASVVADALLAHLRAAGYR